MYKKNKDYTKTNIVKKILALLMTVTMCFQLVGVEFSAAEVKASSPVTRLEWLKALTTTFKFTVEEDNYPDDYYSDIDESSPDYYDIMLATEFGLVDVKAGEALRPNDAATREFAAHTLNLCMGYVLNSNQYTFSESETVTYPEDIQVAIDRGWFSLSNGNFFPNQAVTQEEKTAMIGAAQAVIAEDEKLSGNNTYKYKASVIVLPQGTEIHSVEEGKFAITDCPVEIKTGDIFGQVCDGIPLAWRALDVKKNGSETVITFEGANSQEAFEEVDLIREIEVDLAKLKPAGENVTLNYVVGGTEENNYEDGIICENLEEADGRDVNAVIVEQTADLPTAYASPRGAAPKIKIDARITNATQKHGISRKGAYIDFDFKVDLSCNVSSDILKTAGISPSYELFYAEILPGIYVKGVADLSFYGSVNARLVEDVHLGFHFENFAARLTKNFKKDSFTVTATASVRAGISLEAGFHIPGLNGKIFGDIGAKITAKSMHYNDGLKPAACQTLSSYFYASVGYDVFVDVLLYKGSLASGNKDIYTEYNSPVKTAFHYEDGKAVSKCTRGTPGMGYGGWGYFSPMNSQYYYNSGSSGSSYGNGEVYTIFDYKLNEDNQAIITKYRYTAVNVFVPETLDGYKVVGIDDSAFKDNKRIKSVSIADSVEAIGYSTFENCTALERVTFPDNEKFVKIEAYAFMGCSKLEKVELPDSVTEIGIYAFRDCTELSNVKLPKKVEKIGSGAFENCDKIVRIEIPKSLKSCEGNNGPFGNCDGLKEVVFEDGTTEVSECLFWGCTGLEEIKIPDTVTVIESSAFKDCVNLKEVKFNSNLTEIEDWAFYGCSKLEKVELPDSITDIGWSAFIDCISLKEAIIPDSVIKIGDRMFSGCTSLEKVHIPNTLKTIPNHMFNECNKLADINFPETLTRIEYNAFYNCDELKELNLPSQVETIGYNAFYDCDSLTKVTIPSTVTEMGNHTFYHCDSLSEVSLGVRLTALPPYAFAQCPKLTKIVLPYRMTKIEDNAFNACTGLTEISMPKGMESIGSQVFSYPGRLTIYGVKGTYTENYAKDNDIKFVNCEVKAEKAELNQTALKIKKGYSKQIFLTVTPSDFTEEVVWESDNPEIATVTDDGEIKGISCGTAVIKATAGNVSATCNITVVQPVTSIYLSKSSAVMAAGEVLTLTAEVYPEDATDKTYSWSSSDSSVATVNQKGEVTAIAEGTAEITVKALDGSGVTRKCTINVTSQTSTGTSSPKPSEKPNPNVSSKPTGTTSFSPRPTDTTSSSPKPTGTDFNTIKPSGSPASMVPGDADLDGKLSINDVTLVLKAALKITKLDEDVEKNVDVNQDNKIDMEDVTRILKAALKIIKL